MPVVASSTHIACRRSPASRDLARKVRSVDCVPGLDAVGLLAAAWRVGGVGRVAGEATPADGVLERSVQDRVDVVDRAPVEPVGQVVDRATFRLAAQQRGERVLGDVRGLVELGAQLLGGVDQREPVAAQFERALDDGWRVAAPGSRR